VTATQPGRAAGGSDRDALIVEHLGLVRSLARRYADRGEPLDDLVQAGAIGLINAADRFDPARGVDFRSFAAPTILGEIRRHFRDRTWTMRVPRSLKDDWSRVSATVEELTTEEGRTPSVAGIAERCGISQDRVLDALAAQSAYRPRSISAPAGPDAPEGDRELPITEEGFDRAEDRVVLADGLRSLPARERVIVHMRFDRGMLQSQIAAELGISQMHVSRLIARAVEHLRRSAEGEAPPPAR
jgi:RNA polymerase sigma-B factor